MAKKFKDNAQVFILAMDFDGTITNENIYPEICDQPRAYVKQVLQLLHDVGVKIVIWTCRDIHVVDGVTIHDDITPMKEWLDKHGIIYDSVNSSIEFAPFYYSARKIYAHRYVDDMAFGWYDAKCTMLDVLEEFMGNVMGVDPSIIGNVLFKIISNSEVDIDAIKRGIRPI